MRRLRLSSTMLMLMAVPAAVPLAADEAPGFRPEATLVRQRVPAPLRIAESAALEPMARLAPSAQSAAGEIAALNERNLRSDELRRPLQVGFARELSSPLRLTVDRARFSRSVGARSGGGILGRETSGNFVWGTSVEVADAVALRLELSEVNLPSGSRLWVYGLGGEARSFDLRRMRGDRSLVSPVIEGDRIQLEVELPDGALSDGQGFVVRRVHELLLSRNQLNPFADACLQDASCYGTGVFPAINDVTDGIIQYLFTSGGGTFACSGGLLNDNAPATLEPWILTANHCIGTQAEALTVDTAFFYRTPSCGSGSSSFELGPLGADLVATSAIPGPDVSLLRAIDPTEVPPGVFYLGWTSVRPADGTILHRLSHPVMGGSPRPQVYSQIALDETPAFLCTGDGITVANFLHGVNQAGTGTSGGSSGSPVMKANGQVVGQLLGGCGNPSDGCGTDENSLDGAFAAAYPTLSQYLNPGAGGLCVADADTACLLGGRFKVEVTWQTLSGSGAAQVMYFNAERAETDQSAFFWFFNPTNFEMGVKMVDACVAPYNRFWVFYSGLTSQGFQVRVTRMADGLVKTFAPNPIDNLPTTVGDTDAFTCIP
ncbi:MAG: trypsin-like peptidase domain-containing protein [Thermoanaerobaculia bacterium]